MELFQILLQILNRLNLPIFIPASVALTVAFIAIRGGYIHDSRIFDQNFLSNKILSKASKNKETADAYKEIAKSLIIRSLQYKCKALFLTFPIVYMFFASLFFISAIVVHNLFLVLAFPLALLAVISFIFENSLHLPPRKSYKMRDKIIGFFIKLVIWLNSKVPPILGKKTSFSIRKLGFWEEIKDQFKDKNDKDKNDEIKELKKDENVIKPLEKYNLLPWSSSDNGRSSIGRSKMRKISALLAITVLTVIFGSGVWTYYRPLFPTVVIALAGVGALILIWKH